LQGKRRALAASRPVLAGETDVRQIEVWGATVRKSCCLLAALFCLASIFSGCAAYRENVRACEEKARRAQPHDSVLVSQYFEGGRRCDGVVERPDVDMQLRDNCIVVFSSSIKGTSKVRDQSCTGPEYRFWHYARIWRPDLPHAQAMGYKRAYGGGSADLR